MRIHLHLVATPRLDGGRPTVRWIDEILARVDAYEIDRVSTGDVFGNHLECFMALGYMASRTRRVQVGPLITTAAHRHIGLLASAAASLDAISHGRAYLVIGRGDGIVRNLGLRAQTVDQTRATVLGVRALLDGEPHKSSGASIKFDWPVEVAGRVPICVAAGGERMLRMAVDVADGVYLGTGCTEACVARAQRTIASSGRDRPLDVWWVTRFGIATTTDEALAIASEGLSSIGNHALRGDYAARDVPAEFWQALAEYHTRYDYSVKNARRGSGKSNVDLMNELGLRDYFLDRFGVAGTPTHVAGRLTTLQRRGVDSVTLLATGIRDMELLGERVLPLVRADGAGHV